MVGPCCTCGPLQRNLFARPSPQNPATSQCLAFDVPVPRVPNPSGTPKKALFFQDRPLSSGPAETSKAMLPSVRINNPRAVERYVEKIFRHHYPREDFGPIHQTFADVENLFAGRFPGYRACDMRYHDLEHTMQGTVALTHLLDGLNHAPDGLFLSAHFFTLGIHAILLHDSGYLKEIGDVRGTGAKYTITHVDRSMDFAERYLALRGYLSPDLNAVRHMIHCTGFYVDTNKIPFQSEAEKMIGFALGTTDLLGQMAAPNYLEELDGLYEEFHECVEAEGPAAGALAVYKSPDDMRAKTPQFFHGHAMRLLVNQWGGVYRFMERPLGSSKNPYLEAIEAHIRSLSAKPPRRARKQRKR